jgi:DNA-directed RNA polymerase subunit RPC12/RpoP
MAETITITCPDCEKQLKGPAELAGKRVRCKFCSHIFTVAARPNGKGAPEGKPAKGKTAAEPKPGIAKPAPAAPAKAAKTKPAPETKPTKAPSNRSTPKEEVAEVQPADEPALPLALQGDTESKNPYQLGDVVQTSRCPQCAAEFDIEDQVVCLECGYNTQTRVRSALVKTYETTTMERIVWLLPGVVCVLVALTLVSFVAFLWIIWWTVPPDDEWWKKPIKIWGGAILVFIAYLLGHFAFRRLVVHPSPPEKIKR